MTDEAPGPPIVLVHGIRMSGACWAPHRGLLHDRRVATPDLPGHGLRRGERFDLDVAVAAVAEAIGQVGGRAVLAGHSLGGYVAIATAARYPDKVAALIGAGCSMEPRRPLRAGFLLARRLLRLAPDRGAELSARIFRRVLPAEVAEPLIAAGIATEVIPSVMDAAARFDPLTELAAYPGPTLLLNGGHDHFRLGERRFLAACPDGALRVVPGAGHYYPLIRWREFFGDITGVLPR